MRVIAGEFKGRNLKAPSGRDTRPTTDRVKESVFSSLTSVFGNFEGITALDAFAGTGSLGIELLSRGAKKVIFCEKDRLAARLVRENLHLVKADPLTYEVFDRDVLSLPRMLFKQTYELILLDPPYKTKPFVIADFLDAMFKEGLFVASGLVYYEHAKKDKAAVFQEIHRVEWNIVTTKDFGDTTTELIRKETL